MSYRLRKWLSAALLLIGLPVYIFVATHIVSELDRPHILIEALVYLALGILWALPFKWLFKGIGREDPSQQKPAQQKPDTPPDGG